MDEIRLKNYKPLGEEMDLDKTWADTFGDKSEELALKQLFFASPGKAMKKLFGLDFPFNHRKEGGKIVIGAEGYNPDGTLFNMKDVHKEKIIKTFQEKIPSADVKPNMGGGITVHLKESVNEAKVKVGDILYKDGRKGKVVKVMSDMANVDFGGGDVYGITFRRIKGDQIDESVNEVGFDVNDPVLMKARAAAAKKKQKQEPRINPDYKALKNAPKIKALEKQRAQLMRDMEQEAEPEGGPIADKYGRALDKIDAKIAKLKESVNEAKYRVEYTTQDGEKAKSRVYNSEEEADKKEADLVNSGIKQAKVVKVEESVNEGFTKGQKVTYLGHPGVITGVYDRGGKKIKGDEVPHFVSVSYDKGIGKTKAYMILATDGTVKPVNENEDKKYKLKVIN